MVTNAAETARECLRQIRPAALEYDEWLAVGMACKDAGLAFEEWDAWSRQDSRYKPREMQAKWNSFRGGATSAVGVGTLVKLCRDQGGRVETAAPKDTGTELAWDAVIGARDAQPSMQVVRQEWLQDQPLPPEPGPGWNGIEDLRRYLAAVFQAEELVGYVCESWQSDADQDGKRRWLPKRGVWDRTAGELIERLSKAGDIGEVMGDCNPEAGAWVRHNPLDGRGVADENVTAYRHCLVESDEISVERQFAIYRQLELPITALVHSGGKSLHAIVKVEAHTFAEYQKRVDFLYEVCKKNGLVIDRKNRNPSRLSRLPGVTRNGKRQWLVATSIGKPTWAEWADWIAAVNDDLPAVENLAEHLGNLPPLAEVLIEGILRRGHKLLLTGPANAGKSLALLHLAIAIAEGRQWLGWQCASGRVLYVNLEVDRASCYHRLAAVYKALDIVPAHADDIDVWNLRGQAQSLDQLAPRLIRRALKGGYAAVIIDPIYKVLTGDENAAHEMARFCNNFDRVCRELGSAVIYCHHHSKGWQGAKGAADRASGSGVFKRDPDALLDMIELQIDEARRMQLANRWECAAMAAAFDAERPQWREQCPQDYQVIANRLASWAEGCGLGDLMRQARPAAALAAARASGWRLECGTVREFAKFDPVRAWFRYPLHVPDTDGLLADALADGEDDPKRRDRAVRVMHSVKDSELSMAFADLSATGATGGEVRVEDVARELDCDVDTVRNRIKSAAGRGGTLRYRKGVVFDANRKTETEG